MTGREALDGRKRRVMGVVYFGGGAFLAALFGGQALGQPAVTLLCLPAFAIAYLGMLFGHFFGSRCPWCRSNLAPLAFWRGGLSLDRKLQLCPYCGHQLDEELPEREVIGVDDPATTR